MKRTKYRVGAAFYMPFAADLTASIEAQLLRVDCIFAIVTVDDIEYAWIDGIDEENPVLIPVHSLEGFNDLGELETYLCDEAHTQLGEELTTLLGMVESELINPTVLVRALAIMHNEQAASAHEAVQLSFEFGLTFARAASLERYAFGLDETIALVHALNDASRTQQVA